MCTIVQIGSISNRLDSHQGGSNGCLSPDGLEPLIRNQMFAASLNPPFTFAQFYREHRKIQNLSGQRSLVRRIDVSNQTRRHYHHTS